jgi:retron-type reverse transcriptase
MWKTPTQAIARGMRQDGKSYSFGWPPSPNLNLIEKVWRWIKGEINKLDTVPLIMMDLKEVFVRAVE